MCGGGILFVSMPFVFIYLLGVLLVYGRADLEASRSELNGQSCLLRTKTSVRLYNSSKVIQPQSQ